MRYIILSMLVFLSAALVVGGYALSREKPAQSVSGDYAAAASQAEKSEARLLLVVDAAPPYL